MTLPHRAQLVAYVAQRITEVQRDNKKRWHRRASPMDYVPAVREVVGILLYDDEARSLLDLALREDR